MQAGRRVIVPINGGSFTGSYDGETLEGKVEPGGFDWVLFSPDGVMKIDVRIVLTTSKQETIYAQYQGRLLVADDSVHKKMASGDQLDANEYSLVTTVKFETGSERLKGLNNAVAVAEGRQTGYQPSYEIFEIGALS